jgi:RHH-type proline utilization regulon transcriptional repressor/proline dehydrogenase/delta 1-pyrroline-5-carboxylate dehydrogenase
MLDQAGDSRPEPLSAAQRALIDLATTRMCSPHGDAVGLLAACQHDAADTLFGLEQELPGPTGERNIHSLHPRGSVLCVAASETALLRQLSAVLATGNVPRVLRDSASAGWVASWPPALAQVVGWLDYDSDWTTLRAVLFAGDPAALAALQARVTALPQAIVPILHPAAEDGRYPLQYLVREQVVSINTAAAGGNASLMMLAN